MVVDNVLLAELEDAAEAAKLNPIITVKQPAEFAGVHHRTIRRWIRTGRLHATKTHPGQRGDVRILLSSLLKMLARAGGSSASSYRLPDGTQVG